MLLGQKAETTGSSTPVAVTTPIDFACAKTSAWNLPARSKAAAVAAAVFGAGQAVAKGVTISSLPTREPDSGVGSLRRHWVYSARRFSDGICDEWCLSDPAAHG